MNALPALDTARLRLRPLDGRDEAFYCAVYTDPDAMRHLAGPMAADAARRAFATVLRQQGRERALWVLVDRASDAALGLLGLAPGTDEAEIGVLLRAAGQGRGLAAEAIAAVAGHVFACTPVRALWTRHHRDNAPAAGLMRRLGFEPTPTPTDAAGRELRWTLRRERWSPGHPAEVAPAANSD